MILTMLVSNSKSPRFPEGSFAVWLYSSLYISSQRKKQEDGRIRSLLKLNNQSQSVTIETELWLEAERCL